MNLVNIWEYWLIYCFFLKKIPNSMEFRGLKNEGENNCYLNVIIQVFWNFNELKNDFMSIIHAHAEKDCISCEITVFII